MTCVFGGTLTLLDLNFTFSGKHISIIVQTWKLDGLIVDFAGYNHDGVDC